MTGAPQTLFKTTDVRTRKGRTLRVRACSSGDLGTLVEMYSNFEPKRVAQGLPPPDSARITRWLEQLQTNSQALLAWDGKKIVAHTILCPIRQDEVEFTIFVLQGYREDGLGTVLSELTLAWALEMGLSKVFLSTELSNYRAVGLFRKLGFRTTSREGDECEMRLDLPIDARAQAA